MKNKNQLIRIVASIVVFILFLIVRLFPSVLFYGSIGNIYFIPIMLSGFIGSVPIIFGYKWYSVVYFYAYFIGWVVNVMSQPFMNRPETYIIHGGIFHILMIIIGIITGTIVEIIICYFNNKKNATK